MSEYERIPSPVSVEPKEFLDHANVNSGEVAGDKDTDGPATDNVCTQGGDGEGNMLTSATPDGKKNDGTIPAGPGESRRLINFDVKAFFENPSSIKNIGRDHNMSFRISGDAQIMRDILKAHGFIEMPFKSRFNNFSWIGNSISELCIDQLLCYQCINHFVGSTTLTRKDKLYKHIAKMRRKKGAANFDFIPTSFLLPKEMRNFKQHYKMHPGPFIVKPAGLSRGRGVYLIGKPKDIISQTEDQVVSKYIDNPLLIDGYKVDLRIYVLVTSFDPLVIYIYQEGLTRFATVKYKKNPLNLNMLRMHLTNYSINMSSGNYIRNEDSTIEDFGSKWTLSALLRYFHDSGIDTVVLMRKIEDVIIKTILAAEKSIASGCRIYQRKPSNCFELFGFDIMLDDNYKPWLLEVNLSPSLVCNTPLDIKVKANMLCDLLNLVGLECYTKEKPREGPTWSASISSYIHRTVGYFCVCIVRDELRQLISRPRRRKKINAILGTYKEKCSKDLYTLEARRAKYLTKMTTKEREMVCRIRNEAKRGGGWVKIFPAVDSWQKYKQFMRYKTVKNVLLHQCLYPDQHFRLLTQTVDKSNAVRPSRSDQLLLKNTKSYKKSELGVGLPEMLQRLRRYMSSLQIGPPPQFQVRYNYRDSVRLEEDMITMDAKRIAIHSQVKRGFLLTEVQARSAFLRYFTGVKKSLRYCQTVPNATTCPPIHIVKDLLFQFLGQNSDLYVDPTKPPREQSLETCLTSFLYHYHQETRELMAKGDICDKDKSRNYVSPDLFEIFMHSANQWELESLLTTYLNIHGDPTIFLRNRIKNRCPGCKRTPQEIKDQVQETLPNESKDVTVECNSQSSS